MNVFLLQILSAYEKGDHMLAFVGSLIALEHPVKSSAEMLDGNFHTALQKIRDENKITPDEYEAIKKLKNVRNKMFHENVYATVLIADGLVHMFSEDSTYKYLLDRQLVEMLQIIEKLVRG